MTVACGIWSRGGRLRKKETNSGDQKMDVEHRMHVKYSTGGRFGVKEWLCRAQ